MESISTSSSCCCDTKLLSLEIQSQLTNIVIELVDGVGSAAIIGETGTEVDIRVAGIEGDVREAGTEGDVVKEGTGACAATSTEGELIWWCVEREEPAL